MVTPSHDDLRELNLRFKKLDRSSIRLAVIRARREKQARLNGQPLDELESEMERIIYCKPEDGAGECERLFLTKFKHDPVLYWQPESSFEAAVDILREFIRVNNLSPTFLRKRVGAATTSGQAETKRSVDFNADAWIEPEELLKVAHRFKKVQAYSSDIEVKLLDDDAIQDLFYRVDSDRPEFGGDTIYVLVRDNHCYILLDLPSEKRCYIADGLNLCETLSINEYLLPAKDKSLSLTRTIVPVRFKQQRCVDHCGSSAASILLEFKRIYKHKADTVPMPDLLSTPKSQLSSLVRRLHRQNKSNKLDSRTRDTCSIANWSMHECRYKCGKRWRKITKIGLLNHERACARRAASSQ